MEHSTARTDKAHCGAICRFFGRRFTAFQRPVKSATGRSPYWCVYLDFRLAEIINSGMFEQPFLVCTVQLNRNVLENLSVRRLTTESGSLLLLFWDP